MNVCTALVLNREAAKAMEPCDGALDDPASNAHVCNEPAEMCRMERGKRSGVESLALALAGRSLVPSCPLLPSPQ